MAKPKDNVSSLLAAIQRTPRTASPAPPAPDPAVPAPKVRTGKQAQFWLHEDDRRLIRELAAWLAGQGVRPTDSLVVRAALRTAQGGEALLAAYKDAAARDGRLKDSK
jgi:hypothetical protein